MVNLHMSPHAIEVTKAIGVGTFVAMFLVLAAVTTALMIYKWFIA